MALLVLFTTTSFSVDMHYCGDHLIDFSLSGDVERCMMQPQISHETSSCPMMEMKMDCCSDVELAVTGHDDLQISFYQLSFDKQLFITSFVYTYSCLFENRHQEKVHFKDYSPPPLIRDVQVLDQTFLI
ncbi:HYC_CC_PP family protein [Maribacter cobaltidurans]|uniref:Uncharacterized protein n=2 Tax=Flavobacteriaceae TaxID=49546 RepID=A0A223V293_9FLAO|nr:MULTISPECIES: hypothetical protein [Maribacter]ASV29553.1 hypothetical protein CJ263_04580 [Maribacter cobaltidurans]PIB28959.1 hypothetical protein BFP75_03975 [Maribacter sp. 4G9]GGD68062.1 hypothetical protein GCM10011412_02010 [Maribacter cobaltidurans]